MRKILIATKNPGKFKEITSELADLDFTFVNLTDLKLDHIDLDEPYHTTWENALHKAKFFAHKSKLLTVAEDTGLFIDALDGKPGVHTKRNGPTEKARVQCILDALKAVPLKKRTAFFQTNCCVYDPAYESFSLFEGKAHGLIPLKASGNARPGMEHDAIFYYPPIKKLFSQMTPLEKNLISHRGQAINQLKIYLQRHYGFRQIVVPLALVVKDRKLLMTKRRDSRPKFNNKWEFPGGGVEDNETIEGCIVREGKEETGYSLKIVERLPHIVCPPTPEKQGFYKVFLIGFVATIISGKFQTADNETAGHGWFTLHEALKQDLLPLNRTFILLHKTILKKYID